MWNDSLGQTGHSEPSRLFAVGWGVSPVAVDAGGTPRARAGRSGRGGRGRRGRGKGGRRGTRGYRRGRGYGYDEEDESESDGGGYVEADAPPTAQGVSKIVVEQIYGWRWPLSEKEKELERSATLVPRDPLFSVHIWLLYKKFEKPANCKA